jgi:DNA-binding transcriptional ArsR family regulator
MVTHQAVRQDTGEVFDLAMSARVGRRRKAKRKMYALMDLEALDELELTGSEWEVLHCIMRAVNPETNEANISISEIGDRVGVAPQNVSRSMKELRDRRIVFTLRLGTHRVNAHIMYRGSNADWDIATDTEHEPTWKRATS